jgi:hypothetical protein
MSGVPGYTEVPLEEVANHATLVWEALERVCASPSFQTSPKSCEFLRHIVDRVIAGEPDELKERLIGMSLMGREASYDTASDAGVRVRANDVRKRLKTYNAGLKDISIGTFELPSGSYVPRFYRSNVALSESTVPPQTEEATISISQVIPTLSLQSLAAPTVVALFLCVICLRWQIDQEHPFTTFWQGVFQHGPVLLYLPVAVAPNSGGMVGKQAVEASVPILNLAGQFRSELTLAEGPQGVADNTVIAVGGSPGADGAAFGDANGKLTLVNTSSGRRIVDARRPANSPVGNAAAGLLTIENEPNRRITIDGTDSLSIQRLVRLLCDRDTFPDVIADADQSDGTTQIVFPMTPGGQPIVFHPAAKESSRLEGDKR